MYNPYKPNVLKRVKHFSESTIPDKTPEKIKERIEMAFLYGMNQTHIDLMAFARLKDDKAEKVIDEYIKNINKELEKYTK